MSGKSHFIEMLLKHRDVMFTTKFVEIFYCLPPEAQHSHDQYLNKIQEIVPDINIVYGLPKHDAVFNHILPKLFIFDDMVRYF